MPARTSKLGDLRATHEADAAPAEGPKARRVRLLAATFWFGAVLLARQKYGWPARLLVVPIALAPFARILLWVRRHPT